MKPTKPTKMVDPKTGILSNAADAIPYKTYINRRTVDPKSGKFSDAKDAIAKSTYNQRRTVDPKSGKPSEAKDAIAKSTYNQRRTVDPNSGKPSDAKDAIAKSAYMQRRTVDPNSGKPSEAKDAITYSAYVQRAYRKRKAVKRDTVLTSSAENANTRQKFLSLENANATTESSTRSKATMTMSHDSSIRKRHNHVPEVITTQPNTQDDTITTTTQAAAEELELLSSLVALDKETSNDNEQYWDTVLAYDPNTNKIIATQHSTNSAPENLESSTLDTRDLAVNTTIATKAQPSQLGLFAHVQSQTSNEAQPMITDLVFDFQAYEDQVREYFKSA